MARQAALARGIVLNGLAVMDCGAALTAMAGVPPPPDEYYWDEVIGGPGAFPMVAEGFASFEAAVRRRIIREIATAPGAPVERAHA